MKKQLITLSAIAALSTTSFAATDIETKIADLEMQIKKLQKQVKSNKKQATDAKILAASDNIKWDVDFRTAVDNIRYVSSKGVKTGNNDLLTNRLWLGMGYAPDDNNLFKGKLSYFKAYGDSGNHSQANTNPGYADFDWVTNENPTDNTLKVKEAYWLYMNDTLGEYEIPWTLSFGRRPSTDGLGINFRENMKDNSPLSHTVNVEFDGASAKFNLDKVTDVEGMWFKLCTGRGLTNANPRFTMPDGNDYAPNADYSPDTNMYGFIFVPYDNGQYSVHTNWAKADHMIGFGATDTFGLMGYNDATATAIGGMRGDTDTDPTSKELVDVGSLEMSTIMFKAEGIGNEVSDFLDDTRFFASFAMSKTHPNGKSGGMLGSTESKTGYSGWVGLNMPCPLTDDGRFGVEWNEGSKYWRSVTYGEDTMTGSKIAARGDAVEVYYHKPLTKVLSLTARWTSINYDYTGSNGFFGTGGMPLSWAEVAGYQTDQGGGAGTYMTADPVKEARDFRVSVSYRF
jgi:hypothetical protein